MYLLRSLLVLGVFLAFPAQLVAEETATSRSFFGGAKTSSENDKVVKTYDEKLTPDLIYRVAFGRGDDVQILLEHGANPDSRNNAKIPILSIAATRKDDEAPRIVNALLTNGATVNIVGPDGNLPVTETVVRGRADVLQLLIDNRALLGSVRGEGGKTLLELAQFRGDDNLIAVLEAGLKAEKEQIEGLKSEENFIRMVQDYAFLNCADEYMNYYISTEPGKLDMVRFDTVMNRNSQEIDETGRKIKFIFKMSDEELRSIKVAARTQIVDIMEGYLTNRNREINGIGRDDDLNKRCWIIARKWKPGNVNKQQYKLNLQ